MRYVCKLCGYHYDETVKGPMPEDYICPLCGADKTLFEEEPAPTKE